MSFNYKKSGDQHSNDSFWTSYSDLFLGLSCIFLLLYVVSSMRQGADSIKQQVVNEQLSQENNDLKNQLKAYEDIKNQYMPSFHMEHCVFAAFMSEGSSFRDCGKPCEEHRLELKDQFGNHHQIRADQECRNTMFNAVPQSAAKLIPTLLERGVMEFRFESLYERGAELNKKIMGYKNLLENKSHGLTQEIIETIGVLEKYGVSDGTHRDREYKDRKKNQ